MKQGEREAGLQFDDDRWLSGAHGNNVGGADFSLDLVALRLEEALDRWVEIGFPHADFA
ncbi:hypothetical protein D3C83_108540 [compost metagenome]